MSKIVIVWEMGADLGHVTRLDAVAKCLAKRGHSVTCVFRDLDEIQRSYGSIQAPPYKVLQGPRWPIRYSKLSRPPANLVEVLLSIGYHKQELLVTRIAEWRSIFANLDPDLAIFDYAPTALLATRDKSCNKISLDDPFSKAPDIFPLPSFDPDAKVSTANLTISETKFLQIVNQAISKFELSPITQASDIFATHKSFLLSIPELDPFAHLRNSSIYLGPIDNNSNKSKKALNWDEKSRTPKVFAYLKPDYASLNIFLAAISQLNIQGRFFIPGADQEILSRYRNTKIEISTSPYDLSKDMELCDLVVCHGGQSTLTKSVLNGIPALVIPLQQEQLSTTHACVANGLGLGLGHGVVDIDKIRAVIHTLLSNADFQDNAKRCAAHYQTRFTQPALEVVVKHVDSCS
jgi:UDP-N-acetylglucosamine:LPS N-acetylglucosamine transferase